MRRKLIISTYLLSLTYCAFSQTDTIHFFPGQGIDNIKLFQSSQTDVKKFKRVIYTIDKGAAIACLAYFGSPSSKEKRPSTRRNRWKRYYSDSLGLTFEFATKWKDGERVPIFSKMQLQEITITKTCKGQDGIVLGKSTKQDVINSFGQLPSDWKNENYIRYDTKGIAFRFDENLVLIEINLFKSK